jgi:UDP-N-acetylmuramate dehydrogenase
MPGYPVGDELVKIPAGWLIEQAGWKGYRSGDAGVHTKQALVLVNYGSATGQDLLNLAKQVQDSVQQMFGVSITPEVNVV